MFSKLTDGQASGHYQQVIVMKFHEITQYYQKND